MKYALFKRALEKSWSRDTAYHKDAPNWTAENPALGQCAITALLFNEFFGGNIFSGASENGVVHYWNKKFGIKIDLTKQQFDKKLKFDNITKWDREDLLKTGDVQDRYNLLKRRTLQNYAKVKEMHH